MKKLGLASRINKNSFPDESIVLNPAATTVLLNSDSISSIKHGIVVIDCSWEKSDPVFRMHFRGQQRRLPALLAGNPTNYSRLGRLSSVEATAAALYVLGYKDRAKSYLAIYKWGETFLALNRDPLEDYLRAKTEGEVASIEIQYFPFLAKQKA